jgi:DNA-binding NarL/FixJ family response regulator
VSPVHPIRMVLSDASEIVVQGLARVLQAEGVQVVGTALDTEDTLREVRRRRPDVLLFDPDLPGSDPAGLIASTKLESPGTRVLIFSGHARPDVVHAARAAGPDGYVSKNQSIRQAAAAVRALVSGHQPVAPMQPRTPHRRDAAVELMVRSLSERELTVLRHLAAGHSNARIAKECSLALNTVRGHVQSILVKLGVHSKVEAVWFAVQHGVVSLTDAPENGHEHRDQTG